MTGPEHYEAAQNAFENAKDCVPGSLEEQFLLSAASHHREMAQVAATLELAAAQSVNGMPAAWFQTLRAERRQTS